MPEDKLTHRQRVRLEALARTQGMAPITPDTWEVMKAQAEKVEKWLLEADKVIN